MTAATQARMSTRRALDPLVWWAALVEWHNWRLPIKVGAVLTVPVVAAILLGVAQIQSDVASAEGYSVTQRLVALRGALVPLIAGLEQERTMSVERLTGVVPVDPAAFRRENATVDQAAQAVAEISNLVPDQGGAVDDRQAALVQRLDELPSLRSQTLSSTPQTPWVLSDYNAVVTAVLDFDQALTIRFGDPALSGSATALYDIEQAREQVRLEQVVVLSAIAHGRLIDTDVAALQSSEVRMRDRLDDFRAVITQDQSIQFSAAVVGPAVANRQILAQDAISTGLNDMTGAARGMRTVSVADWTSGSDAVSASLSTVASGLAGQLAATSSGLQDQAGNRAGGQSVILFTVLLLAVSVGFLIGRHLLRSLGVLRQTALDVAEHRLPAAVASIEEGGTPDLTVTPVPVHTHEELGQLARAFDTVHGQAVRAAAAQANLRDNLRNIFVNLSRRSQSLVERQLRLMEQLERDERNPEQLAHLFQLDHLATRMRRNNENLMVLSGSDTVMLSGRPMSLADVVRGAVSEIEHYERVTVRTTPNADIVGYAAGDLVRLIAELLDNATSFSPPDTQVYVGGELRMDGLIQLDILDDGIGMASEDLAEAMRRVASFDAVDVPASRQMGLFVVGRLAHRHSIDIALTSVSSAGGLSVAIRVPAELIVSAKASAPPPGDVMPALGPMGSDSPDLGSFAHAFALTTGHAMPVTVPGPPTNGHAPASVDEWGPFRGHVTSAPLEPEEVPVLDSATVLERFDGDSFGWFEIAEILETSVGLPRRAPSAPAPPDLASPSATVQESKPPQRSPAHARSFLQAYQAGIRQRGHEGDR